MSDHQQQDPPTAGSARIDRKVSFSDQIRVHTRSLQQDEIDMPRKELWYTRSEFRQMKREIMEFRKIYKRRSSLDLSGCGRRGSMDSCSSDSSSVASTEYDDAKFCLRGVEHFVFPELKREKERRQDTLCCLLFSRRENRKQGVSFVEEGGLLESWRQTTRMDAMDAVRRALSDAEDILLDSDFSWMDGQRSTVNGTSRVHVGVPTLSLILGRSDNPSTCVSDVEKV